MTLKTLKIAMMPVLLVLLVSCSTINTYFQLESPDGLVRVVISQEEEQSGTRLYYSVYLKKGDTYQLVMDPSPMGVSFAELASSVIREDSCFVENLEFVSEEKHMGETDQYTLVTGKKLQVSNSYNASTLSFQNKDQKQVALEFRAYNDGVAFRYNFTGEAEEKLTVISELTGFDFKDGPFWGQPYDTLSVYTPAYETYYKSLKVGTEEPRGLMWDKDTRRAEFERISKLGIKGVKVDFFQSDKQEIIKQYLGILEDAADFKLLVNFHGCTLPKGWRILK